MREIQENEGNQIEATTRNERETLYEIAISLLKRTLMLNLCVRLCVLYDLTRKWMPDQIIVQNDISQNSPFRRDVYLASFFFFSLRST